MNSTYYSSDNELLDLLFDENSNNIIIYINSGHLNIKYKAINSKTNILYIVDYDDEIIFNEEADIVNSHVNRYYFDLDKANIKANINISILNNSSLNLVNKFLVKTNKEYNIECTNVDNDTIASMDNSAVSLDDSSFSLRCTGKIIKDAKGSSSHQKSRSLVYGMPKYTKIDPILLIEESDVEASHALSSGTIDEETLYYLNSRGIDTKDALELLIYSYLLPNDEFLNEYEDRDKIIDILSKKVTENVK